jgi:hypothetical protein
LRRGQRFRTCFVPFSLALFGDQEDVHFSMPGL